MSAVHSSCLLGGQRDTTTLRPSLVLVRSGLVPGTYFFHTTGELCLSPVGLSSITKLSPKRLVGQMMGIWFMAAALGNLIAGLVAGLIESLPLPQLFGTVGVISVGAGIVLALANGPLRRLAGDVR